MSRLYREGEEALASGKVSAMASALAKMDTFSFLTNSLDKRYKEAIKTYEKLKQSNQPDGIIQMVNIFKSINDERQKILNDFS